MIVIARCDRCEGGVSRLMAPSHLHRPHFPSAFFHDAEELLFLNSCFLLVCSHSGTVGYRLFFAVRSSLWPRSCCDCHSRPPLFRSSNRLTLMRSVLPSAAQAALALAIIRSKPHQCSIRGGCSLLHLSRILKK